MFVKTHFCEYYFYELKLQFIMKAGLYRSILNQESHFKNFNEGVELLYMRPSGESHETANSSTLNLP